MKEKPKYRFLIEVVPEDYETIRCALRYYFAQEPFSLLPLEYITLKDIQQKHFISDTPKRKMVMWRHELVVLCAFFKLIEPIEYADMTRRFLRVFDPVFI